MDVEEVKKHVGQFCYIILKNEHTYTATIPEFAGSSFTIIDKFGQKVSIDCDFISFINPVSRNKDEFMNTYFKKDEKEKEDGRR